LIKFLILAQLTLVTTIGHAEPVDLPEDPSLAKASEASQHATGHCPEMEASLGELSVKMKPLADSFVSSPEDISFLQGLIADNNFNRAKITISPALRNTGIAGLAGGVFDNEVLFCHSPVCLTIKELESILEQAQDERHFHVELLAWFGRHLPDYTPLYGEALAQELAAKRKERSAAIIDGVIIEPLSYAEFMVDKKFPISDLHDIRSHLPMLLVPQLKQQVEKHFTFLREYLKGKDDPWQSSYDAFRSNYYEQFIFWDETSDHLFSFGAFGSFLSYSLWEIFNHLPNKDVTPMSFEVINLPYHGSWGQDRQMMLALRDGVFEVGKQLELGISQS